MIRLAIVLLAIGCKADDKPVDPKVLLGEPTQGSPVDPDGASVARHSAPNGPIALGCMGWSPANRMAACVVGTIGPKVATTTLHFIASTGTDEPPIKIGEAHDLAKIVEIDTALVKHGIKAMMTFPAPATLSEPMTVAGVKLAIVRSETDQAIMATCGGKEVVVIRSAAPTDGGTVIASVFDVKTHVIVELATSTFRTRKALWNALIVAVLDVEKCTVASAG